MPRSPTTPCASGWPKWEWCRSAGRRRSCRVRSARRSKACALLRPGRSCASTDPELGEGPVVELAARRNASRDLKLGKRGLRLAAEVAVHLAGVEALLVQLFLNFPDETVIRAARRGKRLGVRIRLLGMQRGERARRDGGKGHQQRGGQKRSKSHACSRATSVPNPA